MNIRNIKDKAEDNLSLFERCVLDDFDSIKRSLEFLIMAIALQHPDPALKSLGESRYGSEIYNIAKEFKVISDDESEKAKEFKKEISDLAFMIFRFLKKNKCPNFTAVLAAKEAIRKMPAGIFS